MKSRCLSFLLLRESLKPEQSPARGSSWEGRARFLRGQHKSYLLTPREFRSDLRHLMFHSVLLWCVLSWRVKGPVASQPCSVPRNCLTRPVVRHSSTASWSSCLPGFFHWLHWTCRVSPLEVTSSEAAVAVADLFNPSRFLSFFLSCSHSGLLREGCAMQQSWNRGERRRWK